MSRIARLALAAAVAALSMTAHAAPAFEFDAAGNDYGNGSWDFAINFSVTTTVAVTDLGYYAYPAGGTAGTNPVALYRGDGTLLASASVANDSAPLGHFRWAAITPLVLGPGVYQVVGVSWEGNAYTWNDPGFATDPAVEYLGNSWALDDNGAPDFLNFVQNDVADGAWGPNLVLRTTDFATPEPPSLALTGVALGALLLARRQGAGPARRAVNTAAVA